MPFLGQDWRSPGQSWVKTEEGWKKTTSDDKNNNVSAERLVIKAKLNVHPTFDIALKRRLYLTEIELRNYFEHNGVHVQPCLFSGLITKLLITSRVTGLTYVCSGCCLSEHATFQTWSLGAQQKPLDPVFDES